MKGFARLSRLAALVSPLLLSPGLALAQSAPDKDLTFTQDPLTGLHYPTGAKDALLTSDGDLTAWMQWSPGNPRQNKRGAGGSSVLGEALWHWSTTWHLATTTGTQSTSTDVKELEIARVAVDDPAHARVFVIDRTALSANGSPLNPPAAASLVGIPNQGLNTSPPTFFTFIHVRDADLFSSMKFQLGTLGITVNSDGSTVNADGTTGPKLLLSELRDLERYVATAGVAELPDTVGNPGGTNSWSLTTTVGGSVYTCSGGDPTTLSGAFAERVAPLVLKLTALSQRGAPVDMSAVFNFTSQLVASNGSLRVELTGSGGFVVRVVDPPSGNSNSRIELQRHVAAGLAAAPQSGVSAFLTLHVDLAHGWAYIVDDNTDSTKPGIGWIERCWSGQIVSDPMGSPMNALSLNDGGSSPSMMRAPVNKSSYDLVKAQIGSTTNFTSKDAGGLIRVDYRLMPGVSSMIQDVLVERLDATPTGSSFVLKQDASDASAGTAMNAHLPIHATGVATDPATKTLYYKVDVTVPCPSPGACTSSGYVAASQLSFDPPPVTITKGLMGAFGDDRSLEARDRSPPPLGEKSDEKLAR
jgi:hypothetical protein